MPAPVTVYVVEADPETGRTFGVGIGVEDVPQLQESSAVQPGRRHFPEAQVRSDGQSAFVLQAELQLGPQLQLSTAVQPGRRHFPEVQIRSAGHCSFVVHTLLQATTGVGVGVMNGVGLGVAELVGVGVGVGDGLGDGVGVGVAVGWTQVATA